MIEKKRNKEECCCDFYGTYRCHVYNSLVQNGSNPLISVQVIWQQIEGVLGMSDSGC